MKNVVAALDFSDISPNVLHQAKRLATALGCQLWLVHVEAPDPDFVGYDAGPQTVRDQVSTAIHRDHKELQELAQVCRDEGIESTALLLQGPTAQAVLDKAAELGAEYLVVGSHGHSGLRKLLLGSVSEAVVRSSTCPVVVVKA